MDITYIKKFTSHAKRDAFTGLACTMYRFSLLTWGLGWHAMPDRDGKLSVNVRITDE